MISGAGREFIIKDTHRGLYYEDGKLAKILEAGHYKIPPRKRWFKNLPTVECMLVDVRERELTIKGQEILTADKVAIRVSILVQFRVTDPKTAIHAVENFADRLYSDVQLAARRSLASMTLEDILTNRTRLSEDILSDVKESAAGYGVAIRRADVKDLIFPGNLQEIMNRVLAAERKSQADLVEAVLGLDDHPVAWPHAATDWTNPHNPVNALEVADLYNFPPGDGEGQKVGIIELGGGYHFTEDLNLGLWLSAANATVRPRITPAGRLSGTRIVTGRTRWSPNALPSPAG